MLQAFLKKWWVESDFKAQFHQPLRISSTVLCEYFNDYNLIEVRCLLYDKFEDSRVVIRIRKSKKEYWNKIGKIVVKAVPNSVPTALVTPIVLQFSKKTCSRKSCV
jgi:hypothetical protein